MHRNEAQARCVDVTHLVYSQPSSRGGRIMPTADQVASVIIARNVKPWTDAMSLQKLLYYAQAWHLAVTGEPLFDEQFKAYKDGPVVPQVRHTRLEQSSRKRSGQDL